MKKNIILLFFVPSCLFYFSCQKNPASANPNSNDSHNYSIEIFLAYDKIFANAEPDRVQDFDLNSRYLFIWPIGSYGLYTYDLTSQKITKLLNWPNGDFIAFDSSYVFIAMAGSNLCERYSLPDSSTLQFPLENPESEYELVGGMDVYNHFLYVILRKSWDSPQQTKLNKYDLDGNLVESISYPKNTIHMAIANDIVFSINFSDSGNTKLSRFDLNKKTFLEDKLHPTENWDGIRIYNDKFYFTDFKERYIGFIPLNEIMN